MLLECFYHEKGSDKLINEKHCHEKCYEIIQTISTDGNIMIKDTLYPIEHGTVFLINAIDIHCSAPKNVNEYVRNKIIMDSDILDALAKLLGCEDVVSNLFKENNSASVNLTVNEIEHVDAVFAEVYNLWKENDVHKSFDIYSKILHILQICYDNHNEKKPRISDCVSKALQYINENITNDISLDAMSNALFINKYHLCKQFKKSTDLTIMEYIQTRRLSMAKKKLQFSNLKITEIATSCGFSNFSYFSNFFKRSEGITPTQYRDKYKK